MWNSFVILFLNDNETWIELLCSWKKIAGGTKYVHYRSGLRGGPDIVRAIKI